MKVLRDLEIDIRFEQREAHLPQRVVDVRLADRAVTAQVLEDVLKFIAELRKHYLNHWRTRAGRVQILQNLGTTARTLFHVCRLDHALASSVTGLQPARPLPPQRSNAPRLFAIRFCVGNDTARLSRNFCVT